VKTVIGWPRSGTHWLQAMLSGAQDEQWGHSHACPGSITEPVTLIVRDPRDAFASFCRLYVHEHGPEKTQSELLGFMFEKEKGPGRPWDMGWVAHTQAMIDLNRRYPRRAPFVYYERLHSHPVRVLNRILRTLGKRVPPERVGWAVGRTEDRRCDPSTLEIDGDMGRPGKGRERLEAAVLRELLDHCGPMMSRLGYDVGYAS